MSAAPGNQKLKRNKNEFEVEKKGGPNEQYLQYPSMGKIHIKH